MQTSLFDLLPPNLPKPIAKSFTFVDLFAGIGGFRLPLSQLGGHCLAYAEIDREAIATYQNNWNSPELAPNLGDVSQVEQFPPDVDLVVGGVPCQAWSIAGKTLGFADPRGKLWFDVCRLIEQSQPKAFLLENVKGLTEPRHRGSFDWILHHLRNSGYCVYWQILNSYDFGLPQDRDRLFLWGLRRDLPNCNQFKFFPPSVKPCHLYDFLEDLPNQPVKKRKFSPQLLFGNRIPASRGRFQRSDELNDFFLFTDVRDGHTTIHSWDLIPTSDRQKLICETLLKNRRKKKYGSKDGNPLNFSHLQALIPNLQRSELKQLVDQSIFRITADHLFDFENSKISTGINGVARIFLPHAQAIGTLTASGTKDFIATATLPEAEPQEYKQNFIKSIYLPGKFRALTPQDYAKLQGFPEDFAIHPNPTIAKKQFGNAVSIPIVYHLAQLIIQYF